MNTPNTPRLAGWLAAGVGAGLLAGVPLVMSLRNQNETPGNGEPQKAVAQQVSDVQKDVRGNIRDNIKEYPTEKKQSPLFEVLASLRKEMGDYKREMDRDLAKIEKMDKDQKEERSKEFQRKREALAWRIGLLRISTAHRSEDRELMREIQELWEALQDIMGNGGPEVNEFYIS